MMTRNGVWEGSRMEEGGTVQREKRGGRGGGKEKITE